MRPHVVLLLTLLTPSPSFADDGAASIAAGGIVLMKRETRIVMAKEVLRIGRDKVVVDYEFRNDSDTDITTLVAFPVPAYSWGDKIDAFFGDAGFDDFKLRVNDEPKNFTIETRAFIGKREVTALLAREHIDSASFGHASVREAYAAESTDLTRVSSAARGRLFSSGVFDKDSEPQWKVKKKYYWTQTFPAHGIVRIEHSYSPVRGGTNSVRYGLEMKKAQTPTKDASEKYLRNEIDSLCLSKPLEEKLLKLSERDDMSVPFTYVDFILTTANTWKTPIEDFTLIVEKPAADKSLIAKKPLNSRNNETLVSFCWNGPIEKTDATHFTAHTTNLIPSKELRIGFVNVDQESPNSF